MNKKKPNPFDGWAGYDGRGGYHGKGGHGGDQVIIPRTKSTDLWSKHQSMKQLNDTKQSTNDSDHSNIIVSSKAVKNGTDSLRDTIRDRKNR